MSVSMRRMAMILLLIGLLIGCAPANTPNQPSQPRALAPTPMGAPRPTRVYDVPLPPTQPQPTVALPPTAEPTAEAVTEPTDAPPAQEPSANPEPERMAWGGKVTILHTNDSVGYLDPCG
jgi:hypothetical protein